MEELVYSLNSLSLRKYKFPIELFTIWPTDFLYNISTEIDRNCHTTILTILKAGIGIKNSFLIFMSSKASNY